MPKGQYDYAAAAAKRKATIEAKKAAAAGAAKRRPGRRKAATNGELVVPASQEIAAEIQRWVPSQRWQELCERHSAALDLLKLSKANEQILLEHIDRLDHQLKTVRLALSRDYTVVNGTDTFLSPAQEEILQTLGHGDH